MSEPIVLVTIDAWVATVAINRPAALNALNAEVLTELGHVATQLEGNGAVRAVILTGAGPKAFVAGADIAEMANMAPSAARVFADAGAHVGHAIEHSRLPWIAAVNGFALGGGCEMALACDFIYAARTARFGQPEVNLGVIPGFGGTQRLLRRVGIAKARELVYTGDIISADEALRIGLADVVCEPAELIAKAQETAKKIAAKGPLAIAAAKKVMHEGQSQPLTDALHAEAVAFARLFASHDQKEGMAAFLAKRPAIFQGE